MGVLGEKYAPKGTERAFLDRSVLDQVGIVDQVGIERAVRESTSDAHPGAVVDDSEKRGAA